MKDIGLLAGIDPVAIDKACLDLVYNSNDEGKEKLIKRIETRHGNHIIDSAYNLNIGNTEYELINIDNT